MSLYNFRRAACEDGSSRHDGVGSRRNRRSWLDEAEFPLAASRRIDGHGATPLSRRSARSSPVPFATRVIAWQREHGRRDLPWQGTRDAYRIWLSEIMLQQTQVATVLPYYLRFIG
jgi:hypothetical protein